MLKTPAIGLGLHRNEPAPVREFGELSIPPSESCQLLQVFAHLLKIATRKRQENPAVFDEMGEQDEKAST